MDVRDELILVLAERVYICSRLLTCAAERLKWDEPTVQDLVQQLRNTITSEVGDAGIQTLDEQ